VSIAEGLPTGVWPVMLTAFKDDGCLDRAGTDALVEWYIERGVAGLFAVCLSSEMFELTEPERLELLGWIVDRVDGRVPVVAAGALQPTLEAQATYAERVADAGAAAVVLIANQVADERADHDAWSERLDHLLALTGDLPLGIYECPVPYHRLLTVEQTQHLADSGRFVFMKETSLDLVALAGKIEVAAASPLGIYPAHSPSVLGALKSGSRGCCNTAANVYPELFAWLCSHWDSEPEPAAELQRFLTLCDPVVRLGYPVTTKRWLRAQGAPISERCRTATTPTRAWDTQRMHEDLAASVAAWHQRLGI